MENTICSPVVTKDTALYIPGLEMNTKVEGLPVITVEGQEKVELPLVTVHPVMTCPVESIIVALVFVG